MAVFTTSSEILFSIKRFNELNCKVFHENSVVEIYALFIFKKFIINWFMSVKIKKTALGIWQNTNGPIVMDGYVDENI